MGDAARCALLPVAGFGGAHHRGGEGKSGRLRGLGRFKALGAELVPVHADCRAPGVAAHDLSESHQFERAGLVQQYWPVYRNLQVAADLQRLGSSEGDSAAAHVQGGARSGSNHQVVFHDLELNG